MMPRARSPETQILPYLCKAALPFSGAPALPALHLIGQQCLTRWLPVVRSGEHINSPQFQIASIPGLSFLQAAAQTF